MSGIRERDLVVGFDDEDEDDDDSGDVYISSSSANIFKEYEFLENTKLFTSDRKLKKGNKRRKLVKKEEKKPTVKNLY